LTFFQETIMSKLLYIRASPCGVESKSIRVADAYLEALQAGSPTIEVDTLQLWKENLLPFDEVEANAKIKGYDRPSSGRGRKDGLG
jgi:FMN-dependent NADH-azoreductase